MRQPGLTIKQAEVLSIVRDWIATHGYPPTHRELAAHLGLVSTNGVNDHLQALIRKGCLTKAEKVGGCGKRVPVRTLRLAGPRGPGVHLGSAVVAEENGAPSGVAYRVIPVEGGS